MRMNQAGGAGGYPSLTHELNLIPMVLELVEIIQNCGDQQEINRRVMVLKYLSKTFLPCWYCFENQIKMIMAFAFGSFSLIISMMHFPAGTP